MEKIIHDIANNEVTSAALSAQEIAELEKRQAKSETEIAAQEAAQAKTDAAKAAAQAKLAALGLTTDDLKALGL